MSCICWSMRDLADMDLTSDSSGTASTLLCLCFWSEFDSLHHVALKFSQNTPSDRTDMFGEPRFGRENMRDTYPRDSCVNTHPASAVSPEDHSVPLEGSWRQKALGDRCTRCTSSKPARHPLLRIPVFHAIHRFTITFSGALMSLCWESFDLRVAVAMFAHLR
jgi:hypothetical protein